MQAKEGYFVIMVSALVLGSQNGFVIGAITALVSNIFLGQGPWPPWQMYALGMVSLSVGAMRYTLFMKNK
ncbi:ECF transporter S component [Aerococcus christensenii]|uniref:ECF transporter S component n=1 Tax=Aerococcus christensenii TaxID=87541 RepID=UPI0023A9E68E|nr:ECF transporter S component [Aerococcus christensenii]WEB71425.1 ECF transporter S component [Aerococcus christensenii]